MNLDNLNVANHNIGLVITEVLRLCGKVPNRVPKRQMVDNMVAAKAMVAIKQLAAVTRSREEYTVHRKNIKIWSLL